MDFGKDDKKEENDINQNHLVLVDILEDNTSKTYRLSFKYKETPQPAQYSITKFPIIEPLTLLIPKPFGYHISNLPTPELLTLLLTNFFQLPVFIKK